MKHNTLKLLVRTSIGIASIAFLVSCGGSKTETQSIASGTTQENSAFSLGANSPDVPAVTLSALDNVPTIDFAKASSTANTTLALGTKTMSSDLFSGASGNDPVVGFVVKYKNTPNLPGTKKIIDDASLTGNSAMLASGMSVGMASVISKNNIQIASNTERYDASKSYKFVSALNAIQAQAIAAEIQQSDSNIEYVELNKIKHHTYIPNDPFHYQLWALKDLQPYGVRAETAWNSSQGAGMVVAVVDTGYRPHEDMTGQILQGYDFISNASISWDHGLPHTTANDRDTDATDPGDWIQANGCGYTHPFITSSWHGSHVAGTIAANANNAKGIAGLAYKAKILPVRVLGTCGGIDTDIADGIVWAAGGTVPGVPANANPAKIINLSLGGPSSTCPAIYQQAIATARSLGAVVVVAAGNSNVNAGTFSPANCADAITVGATTSSGAKAWFSNYGSVVDISAPGYDIKSTVNASGTDPTTDNAYAYYDGTSMATPHVAAALALMLSANPRMTAAQAEAYIKKSVRAFDASSCTSTGGCGTGILKAHRALVTYAGARAQADFDDDGKSDLITKKVVGNSNRVFIGKFTENAGVAAISNSAAYTTAGISRIVNAVGDFNGDRKTDLLETNQASGKIVNLVYMNGQAVSLIKPAAGAQPLNTFVIGTADLNGDGRDEILLRKTNGNLLVATLSADNTTLTYSGITNIPVSYVYAGSGDTNSDGKIELFWQDKAANSLKIITMNGNAWYSTTTSSLNNLLIKGIGRFLDKTKDSLLVANSSGALSVVSTITSGTLGTASALLDTANQPVTLSTDLYIASIADYNGNGNDDILWRKTNTTDSGIFSLINTKVNQVSLPPFATTLITQQKL